MMTPTTLDVLIWLDLAAFAVNVVVFFRQRKRLQQLDERYRQAKELHKQFTRDVKDLEEMADAIDPDNSLRLRRVMRAQRARNQAEGQP